MNLPSLQHGRVQPPRGSVPLAPRQRASVLIVVLWVAFGLVALALYFAHTMTFELRAADNRVAAFEAGQAIDGVTRYASNILAELERPGQIPDDMDYVAEAIPVGNSRAWFLGRDPLQTLPEEPRFALRDEASMLNLNTATVGMLELLPRMTPELAAAIVDWRDTDSDMGAGGAEDETYLRLDPPYRCKNAAFESVEELGLVAGMTLEILFGEDTNLNGTLDANENDGDATPPSYDNRDRRLDPGLFDLLTVHSREPNTLADGTERIGVTSTNQQQLATLFQETLGTSRANEILARLGPGQTAVGSLLEFFVRSQMTADEFAQVEDNLTATTNSVAAGLVNVNTASEEVLACIPGIGAENAGTLVSRRQSNTAGSTSIAWVAESLSQEAAIQAGRYVTGRSYQFTADVAAVGHDGRGYRRVRHVLDTSGESPRVVARRDLTHLGWSLGRDVREEYLRARTSGEPPFQRLGLFSTVSTP